MNAIVVIAIGKSKIWDICRKTVIRYCKKYNIALEIISDSKYLENPFPDSPNFNMFEKNQIYSLFEKYERILRLDWDTIITPKCPNLFEIVPEDKIGGVIEDVGTSKVSRRKMMKILQNTLGDIGWRRDYINAGVILVSKPHRDVIYTSEEEVEMLANLKMNIYNEQTYLNYKIRKSGFEIFPLKFKFNHTSLFSEPWNKCANKFDSYVIHYAGKFNQFELMLADYNYIFFNISKPLKISDILKNNKLRFTFRQFLKMSKKILNDKKRSFSQKKKDFFNFIKRYVNYFRYW